MKPCGSVMEYLEMIRNVAGNAIDTMKARSPDRNLRQVLEDLWDLRWAAGQAAQLLEEQVQGMED